MEVTKMSSISMKKVLIAVVLILALSRLDHILVLMMRVWYIFYDSFEPLRHSPVEVRFMAALSFLVILWVTAYMLLRKRR